MSQPAGDARVWAIVPAAGLGRRMGAPKQALPYGDSTLAGTVVATLLQAGVAGVVVVTRNALRARLHLPADGRVLTAINDDESTDMLVSVRIGIAALPLECDATRDGVLVVPADMPKLKAASAAACVTAYQARPGGIVVAARGGVRGHPVIIPLALRTELAALTDGLRQLVRQRTESLQLVECGDDGIFADIDTPSDYHCL